MHPIKMPIFSDFYWKIQYFFIFLLFLLERKSKNRNQISLDELNSITAAFKILACSSDNELGL